MRVRGDMLPDRMPIGAPSGVCVSPVLGSAAGAQMEAAQKECGRDIMRKSQKQDDPEREARNRYPEWPTWVLLEVKLIPPGTRPTWKKRNGFG